jgi:hypothetical protein
MKLFHCYDRVGLPFKPVTLQRCFFRNAEGTPTKNLIRDLQYLLVNVVAAKRFGASSYMQGT